MRTPAPIPFDRFHAPRIEVELAFVLKAPLKGPDCTMFDVLNATDYVTPALEILETRMHRVDPQTKAPRKVTDTISDNAANAALVRRRPAVPAAGGRSALDRRVAVSQRADRRDRASRPASSTTRPMAWRGSPTGWRSHDEHLAAGEVVLAGSFTRPVEISSGDTFHADYGPFGSVSCQFV